MKEKLIELFKSYSDVHYLPEIERAINVIGDHSFEDIADQVEELYKDYYPRQFVEWTGFMSSCLIYREIDNKWLIVKDIDKINDWTEFTLEELYSYWQTEIKDKQ